MTFKHKLAHRLALLRGSIAAAILLAACEKPISLTNPGSPVAQLLVSPKNITMYPAQTTDVMAVGFTATGDTATAIAVSWSVTGGTLVGTSTNGGKHYGQYKSGNQTGKYKVVASAGGVSDSASITVAQVPVAAVQVNPASATVNLGQTVQLTATPQDSTGAPLTGRSVTWASNNGSVATVNANGLVTTSAVGSATVTATSEGKSGTAAITGTLVPVASVSVSPASASVQPGGTVQLSATPRDASGNPLTGRAIAWSSSAPGIATVNGGGLVTGVAAGAATITASSEGKSGTAAVTVNSVPVASVTVSPATATIMVGQNVQFTATPKDANGNVLTGRPVTWATNNGGVATVNGSGLVTALAAGTVIVTAACESATGTAGITVTNVPVASVTVSPATASIPVGQTVQLTATPKDANGNPLSGRVVTWISSNSGMASVNGGLVAGVATGSATITATSEGQSGTAAITVTASPPPPSGTWPNAPAGWTVINDYDMHALNNGGWTNDVGGTITIGNDPSAPLSPPSVWHIPFPIGFPAGGVSPANEYLATAGFSDVYVGLWVRFSNPWQGHPTGRNKIFDYLDISGGSIVGIYFLELLGSAPPYHTIVILQTQSVNLDENQDTTPTTVGVWHQWEMLLKRSDGTAKWWIDGKLKGSYTNVPYTAGAKFTQAEVNPIWGGVSPGAKTENDFIDYDHVHLTGHP